MSDVGLEIAQSMWADAQHPTMGMYSKARIDALLIAYENGGQIIPHIRPIGEACSSMDIKPFNRKPLMIGFSGYNSPPFGYQLTTLGREVAGALKLIADREASLLPAQGG